MNLIKSLGRTSSLLTWTSTRSLTTQQQVDEPSKEESKSNRVYPPNDPSPKLVQIVNRERSLNLVSLIGRIGRDPTLVEREKTMGMSEEGEVKEMTRLAVFSMATSEFSGHDTTGKVKFRVDWHRIVVVSEPLQNLMKKYARKGDRIHVQGRLHYNTIRDKNGDSKHIATVLADDVIFLSKNVDPDV